jgi:hypothetical protein
MKLNSGVVPHIVSEVTSHRAPLVGVGGRGDGRLGETHPAPAGASGRSSGFAARPVAGLIKQNQACTYTTFNM